MASIQSYETKKGTRWLYLIYNGINPATGRKQKIIKRGFMSEKEADDAANDLEYKLRTKEVTYNKSLIFKELADYWLDYYVARKFKASTVRNRRSSIKSLNKFFGYLQTRQITKKDYQDMLDTLHNQEYAYNTINGIHATGKLIFEFALNFGIALEDVTAGAKIPRNVLTVQEIEDRMSEVEIKGLFYEKDELATFLKACKDYGEWQDFTLFALLVYSGMRPGELCALKKSDLDFINNKIIISKTIYLEGPVSNIIATPPKTLESARTVDMDPAIMTMLRQHIEWHQAHHINDLHQTYHEMDYLFARTNSDTFRGYPFSVSVIDRKMQKILKKVPDLKRLTPHKLRHTHTSLLAESEGAEIDAIMARLGHKDDKTTRLIYMHVTKHRKERLAKNFSEVMKDFLTIS